MQISRRRFSILSVAAATSLCLLPGVPSSRPPEGPRDRPFIPPFMKSAPQQRHTYLPMQKSLPAIEARLSRWSAVAAREAETLKTSDHPAIKRWRALLYGLPPGNTREVARLVNVAVNKAVRYVSDWDHGQKSEIWYGPAQTLQEGGDCEDFALLKAATLRAHGWPTQAMHLVAGVLNSGEGHMMLGVDFNHHGPHPDHGLLDNLSPDIHPRPFTAWAPKYQIGAHQKSLVYIQVAGAPIRPQSAGAQ